MINLLPDEHKHQIRAARTNVLLVRYIGILTAAVLLLGGLVGASYVTLNTAHTNATKKVEENTQQVANTKYQTIKSKADQFRSDLATAQAIMDKEVTYSKLIYKIADAVPPNVILESLELDSATLGSSATMNASAKSYSDAIALKTAFTENSDVFSDVSFDTLSYTDSGDATYPIKVNLSVTIRKEAL